MLPPVPFTPLGAADVSASPTSVRALPPARRFRAVGWAIVLTTLAAAAFIITRGCGYSVSIPLRYALYLVFHVALPGAVALRLCRIRTAGTVTFLGLVLPTGFALEIGAFLTLSALHARDALPWVPLGWGAVGLMISLRDGRSHHLRLDRATLGQRASWPRLSTPALATCAALSGLFLVSVIMAAANLYAEAPLLGGWPSRPIFHDWVYLLSRAAVIKEHWPLEEPSLAGTPLQYHYFLLVHVASASLVTGVEVSWILLRLVVVPLGLAMICQAYALGKLLTGTRAAGVLAAALVLLPGEVSWSGTPDHPVFLGLFLRWLYVSPTFLFGVVFFGALLLAIPQLRSRRLTLPWVVLLAAGATGAKGSVMPVTLVGALIWIVWTWGAERRVPWRLLVVTATASAAFLAVYALTLSAWGDAGVQIRAAAVCNITEFWNQWAVPCERYLKRALHAPALGTWLGASLLVPGMVLGTSGVSALGFLLPAVRREEAARRAARWLTAVVIASYLTGLVCHFDCNDELYFILLARVPLAALGGAVIASLTLRWLHQRRWDPGRPARPWVWRAGVGIVATAVGWVAAVQLANTAASLRRGWLDWTRASPTAAVNADLVPLYQTMQWIRTHTERDAVLLANAFTSRTIPSGRGMLVDHTTVGVHYYYSALTGRRMWVEGPTYLLDQAEARQRLSADARFFDQQGPPPVQLFASGPSYVVLDHRIDAIATVALPRKALVYSNGQFEVFRLRPTTPLVLATTTLAATRSK